MTDVQIIATSNKRTEASGKGSRKVTHSVKAVSAIPQAEAVEGAHRVLTCCVPGASLPTDVSKLRAMLDQHMFGRDKRALRDDAVRAARQLDSLPSSGAG
jgi:hypothetical protein